MRAATALMAMAGLLGCNIADVGGPEPTSCELAAQHVASCLGYSEVEVTTGCDAQAAAQADGVLQMQCSDIAPDGQRSTMFLKDLLCKLLPFFCSNSNPGQPGPGQVGPGNIFRIGDCWHEAQFGFCYDIAKVNNHDNCTLMLDRPEWQLPHYTRYQCLQPDGDRCRLVRVCQQFADKAQCINNVPHHNDAPKCQAAPSEHPGHPAPGSSCNNDGDCGGGICYWNHRCVPPGSQPIGSACRTVSGVFRPELCQHGLSCKINVAPGHSVSECVPKP